MKKLITFGIALVAVCQVNASALKSTGIEQGESFKTDSTLTEQKHFAPVEDQAILNPSAVFGFINQRPVEEVIAENNQITENKLENDGNLLFIEKSIEDTIKDDCKITEASNTTELRPLYLERTIEDKIAEDNAIIENQAVETQPLDFESINKKQMILKNDTKLLIGMN